MSKGRKLLVLAGLLILCVAAFAALREDGPAEFTAFFSFATVGLLVAIALVASSRPDSRRRS